jgi:hypothetical protein
MRSTKDIAWLAGLVEGEGTFQYNHNSLLMTVVSSDFDVIDRAAKILDATVRGPYKQNGFGTKPMYKVSAYGAEWPMTLYSLLGVRRRAKIRELLTVWRTKGGPKRKRKIGYGGRVFDRVTQESRNTENSEQAPR